TDVTITYSRPGVKGRTIWGDLVPFDKVWRTGANEATSITFSDDVKVNGQALKKGTYSLHTIPNASEWTIIFNSVADQWGSYSYDETKDALRVKAKPEKAAFTEWMSFEVPKISTDEATIVLRWENVAVPFAVNSDTTAKTLAAFKNALKPDWRTPLQAAQFAFDNTGAASDAEINAWIDQSIKIVENTNNLWLKARMQQRAGNIDEAKKTAALAVSKATEAQGPLVETIKSQSASWKK
ncbi:MAG TPA: DUF2911 domain-containing protein, partial [Thermoanaerobaculia bacterium]|nr:DUF2911 domain-containing protein [Thermoanaerobaculia bacterium]